MNGLYGPIRWWARVYTSGLAAATRDRRRAEIDSDVWEHVDAMLATGSSPAVVRSAVWARWLRGVPDDLAWRMEQRRAGQTGSPETEGRTRPMHLGADRSVIPLAAIVAVAIVTAIVTITIGNIQHFEQSQRFVSESTLNSVTVALFAVGIAGIPLGFLVMRGRPAAGAVIAAGGSVVAALVTYWLILPLVAAAVVSALAVRRARRLAQANS